MSINKNLIMGVAERRRDDSPVENIIGLGFDLKGETTREDVLITMIPN